jgi:hypothetical protein
VRRPERLGAPPGTPGVTRIGMPPCRRARSEQLAVDAIAEARLLERGRRPRGSSAGA